MLIQCVSFCLHPKGHILEGGGSRQIVPATYVLAFVRRDWAGKGTLREIVGVLRGLCGRTVDREI